jgi:hypothetical protein
MRSVNIPYTNIRKQYYSETQSELKPSQRRLSRNINILIFLIGALCLIFAGSVDAVECNADLTQGADTCTISTAGTFTLNGTYKLRKYFTLIILLLAIFEMANAQLYTAPLGSNIFQHLNMSKWDLSKSNSRSLTDTLELPFIDDFSKEARSPEESKWLDHSVYINQQMAVKPPSIGVATFDGLNNFGLPYSTINETGAADTLTSHYINLSYPASDSIYLSFYYHTN